jgi:tripartite-type tricarboxylate transporter receptor subunit TctC
MSVRLVASGMFVAAFVFSAASPASSQTKFPEKNIRLVVPFAAGGGVDVLARLLAQKMQPKLGVTILIDNRPGANGTLGGLNILQSPADGYSLLFSASTHIMAQQVMSKAPYNPVNDFLPVARVGEAPLLVVMSPKLPHNTLGEATTAARQNPAAWTVATPALGSPGHIGAIALSTLSKANLTITPYRGTAPALNDVVGGHVQLLVDAIVALLPVARSGQVKALAITANKRSALAPDIPTAAESGLPGLEWASWYGVWGRKGLSSDVVTRLNGAFIEATRELQQDGRLKELGVDAVESTPEEFQRFIEAELARATELLKAADFKPE